jgi:hypothetical protein
MESIGVIPEPCGDAQVLAAGGGIGAEAARGRLHFDDVAGSDLVDQPQGEESFGDFAHADARGGSGRGADRIGAAVLLAVDDAAQGQGLSGREVEEFGVFGSARRKSPQPNPR